VRFNNNASAQVISMEMIYKDKLTTVLKTSEVMEYDIRLHLCHAHIIPSYSPGGAKVHPPLIHGSLGPNESDPSLALALRVSRLGLGLLAFSLALIALALWATHTFV